MVDPVRNIRESAKVLEMDAQLLLTTQEQAEEGLLETGRMTAKRTAQAIAAQAIPKSMKSNLVGVAATVTALAALTAASFGAVDLLESGKKGLFYSTNSNISAMVTKDTLKGIYVPFAADPTGASGGWVRQKVEHVKPRWFGAAWDDTANDKAAIEAADLMARTLGKSLRFPSGTAYIATTVKLTAMYVSGEGKTLSTLRHASVVQPAVLIEPSVSISADNAFRGYKDFGVVGGALTTNCIKVLLSSSGEYFSNFAFKRLMLVNATSANLLFDNTINNVNGIFCGSVEDCFVSVSGNAGIYFVNGGDSLTIRKNIINGAGKIGLFASLVSGARQFVVSENNITTRSECVYLSGVVGAQIISNWMETPSYLGSYTGASGALLYLENASDTTVERNTIQPLDEVGGGFVGANYSVTIAGAANDNIITDNDLADGVLGHVYLTSIAAINNEICPNNRYAEAAVITDNGLGTIGVTKTLALTATWVAYNGTYETLKVSRTSGKTARIFGAIRSGAATSAVVTLPLGHRPLVQQLIPYYNPNDGTNGWFSLSPAGVLTHSAGTLAGCFINSTYEVAAA